MRGRGNCCDTSMVLRRENSPLDCFLILLTFFRTIKSDLVWQVAWQSRPQAENAAARYIDGFHNPVRRHSSTGFQSPIAFTRKAREVSQTLSAIDGQVQPTNERGFGYSRNLAPNPDCPECDGRGVSEVVFKDTRLLT